MTTGKATRGTRGTGRSGRSGRATRSGRDTSTSTSTGSASAATPVAALPLDGPWPPEFHRLRLGRTTVVRVATAGEGPPLLLLNGIGANIEMWEPVVRRMPGRRIVMLDIPGTGGSPPLLRAVRLRGYAALVVRVLDELGVARTDVLGYSWGGALAQELAHRAPTRVGAVALAATMPGLGGQPPSPLVIALMATPARYYSRTYLRLVAPLMFGSAPAQAADSSEGSARLRKPPSLVGYSQQLYAITGWSSRRWLNTLGCPLLVLAGTHDPLIPRRNGRILAAAVPDARLHLVDGGHLFLVEQPDEGCAALRGFFAEHALGGVDVGSQPGTRSST